MAAFRRTSEACTYIHALQSRISACLLLNNTDGRMLVLRTCVPNVAFFNMMPFQEQNRNDASSCHFYGCSAQEGTGTTKACHRISVANFTTFLGGDLSNASSASS